MLLRSVCRGWNSRSRDFIAFTYRVIPPFSSPNALVSIYAILVSGTGPVLTAGEVVCGAAGRGAAPPGRVWADAEMASRAASIIAAAIKRILFIAFCNTPYGEKAILGLPHLVVSGAYRVAEVRTCDLR